MNKPWIEANLRLLEKRLTPNREFEPTDGFYRRIWDISELRKAIAALSKHVNLPSVPNVEVAGDREIPVLDLQTGNQYTKQTMKSAGDVHWDASLFPKIRVGISQCYRPQRLGHILAHEVSHCVLDWRGIRAEGENEVEMLTDLAAVWIGFGKLMLNGASDETGKQATEAVHVSDQGIPYLGYPLLAYAYVRSRRSKGMPVAELYGFLGKPAAKFVQALDCRDPEKKGTQRLAGYLRSLLVPEPNTDGTNLVRESWKQEPSRHTVVSCPRCKASLRIPLSNRTLEIRCSQCGNQFDVQTRFGQKRA